MGTSSLPAVQGLDEHDPDRCWSLADSVRLIDSGAVDCLQLDVTRCGRITEFLRGAALAAAHNMQVSAHCAPNLHARVAAAVPNLRAANAGGAS